ncbi:MAG: Gfo/Idh/MocA family oxidoreductase, partial [Halieaceae bacterium]
MPEQMKALVVGARTVRQGTGPFLTAALHKLNVEIAAVIGTTPETAAEAASTLQTKLGISAGSYSDLDDAINIERPALIVLCSPWQYHEEQLKKIASGGCHCLVEKPLIWPGSEEAVAKIVDQFDAKGLLLQMVAQWPFALSAFESLFGPSPENIDTFNMRLSPISLGPVMVPDAAPHFLSLLQALVGPGECREVS